MKYLSMFFIGSSNHDKQHVFILTLEEVFFENKPSISLVFHLHLCSYGGRKKLEPSGNKDMQYIEDSMDSNIEEKHEEEHEDSKKERKVRTTN
jgi:hypothetical protein